MEADFGRWWRCLDGGGGWRGEVYLADVAAVIGGRVGVSTPPLGVCWHDEIPAALIRTDDRWRWSETDSSHVIDIVN